MTVFAVGLWLWMRPRETEIPLIGYNHKMIVGWRRTLTGKRVRHGRQVQSDDNFEMVRYFQDGRMTGPYSERYGDRKTLGQYENGQREGTWTISEKDQPRQTAHWRHDQLDGVLEIHSAEGTIKRYNFARDRLLTGSGRPLPFPFFEEEEGALDDTALEIRRSLHFEEQVFFDGVPLGEVVKDMNHSHLTHLRLDPTIDPDDLIVNCRLRDLRLLHVVQIIAFDQGLQCRYDDGYLWLEPLGSKQDGSIDK
jgi:hypothetical protein